MGRNDEAVQVNLPGHDRHGERGHVVDRIGDKYVVEFADQDKFTIRYCLETFERRNLRALIQVRV